jgi:hypothetical protein
MVFGVIYWAVWRVVLPKIFGYELVPSKVVLNDGTTVNVVRFLSLIYYSFDVYGADHPSFCVVFTKEGGVKICYYQPCCVFAILM